MGKELILRSKKFPKLYVQILDDKIALLDYNKSEKDEEFFSDNDIFIFEIYKLLKEADKRGAFGDIQCDDENSEEILI